MARVRRQGGKHGTQRREGHYYRGVVEGKARVQIKPEDVPPGYMLCPHCKQITGVTTKGKVRSHRYYGAVCIESGNPAPAEVVAQAYMPPRVLDTPLAIECTACGAKQGNRCVTVFGRNKGAETAVCHSARIMAYEALGAPIEVIPGVNEDRAPNRGGVPSPKRARRRPDIKGTECNECKAQASTPCINTAGRPMPGYHTARVRIATRRFNEENGL